MKNHRKVANQEREILKLSPLPAGPRYTEESSSTVFKRYLHIRDSFVGGVYRETQAHAGDNVSTRNCVGSSDLQEDEAQNRERMMISSHSNLNPVNATTEPWDLQGEEFLPTNDKSGENAINVTEDRLSSHCDEVNLISAEQQPHTDVGSMADTNSDDMGEVVHANDEEGNSPRSGGSGIPVEHEEKSEVQHKSMDVLSDDDDGGYVSPVGHRADSEVRFHEWMRKERRWIHLFTRHGVSLTLMDAIMKLLNAPFGAIQLRRNLEKYTSFHPIRYLSCRGHMLIKEKSDESDVDISEAGKVRCRICSETWSVPDLITFEYLPIRNRLKAWVANEESCRALYGDFHACCESFKAAEQSGTFDALFRDFTDGRLFRRIVQEFGGIEKVKFDLFIAPSCDGFEPYQKGKYSCWPLVALNHNPPPSQRFLMKNVIPLGVIQGPSEPKEVHTWFQPLKKEIDRMNEDRGTLMHFFDGVERRVRGHIIFATGDDPAVNKMAGLTGHNSKNPCRYCNLTGVWSPFHSHMYFPSVCKVVVPSQASRSGFRIPQGGENEGYETRQIYDPFEPSMRNSDEIEIALRSLDDDSPLSAREKKNITDRCGLKARTVLLRIHSLQPYVSFPPDMMHKFMNICHDLFVIFKGECLHLSPSNLRSGDTFILSRQQWKMFHEEICSIKKGTSPSVFPEVPRSSTHATHWKAIECIEFLTNYAFILLEGRLPTKYMKNLQILCSTVELCRRPGLAKTEVECLKRYGAEFVKGFETLYY